MWNGACGRAISVSSGAVLFASLLIHSRNKGGMAHERRVIGGAHLLDLTGQIYLRALPDVALGATSLLARKRLPKHV